MVKWFQCVIQVGWFFEGVHYSDFFFKNKNIPKPTRCYVPFPQVDSLCGRYSDRIKRGFWASDFFQIGFVSISNASCWICPSDLIFEAIHVDSNCFVNKKISLTNFYIKKRRRKKFQAFPSVVTCSCLTNPTPKTWNAHQDILLSIYIP